VHSIPSTFVPPEYTNGSGSSFINIEEIDTTGDAFGLVSHLGTNNGAKVDVAKLVLDCHLEIWQM